MMDSRRRRRRAGARWLAGSCLAAAAGLAAAQATESAEPADRWRALIEAGTASGLRSARVGVAYDWQSQWRLSPSLAVFGYTELTAGRWQVRPSERFEQRSGFTTIGLTPVVRLAAPSRTGPYAELGVGGNVIFPVYRALNKRFSSVFNFGDHLGLGWRLPGRHGPELGIRYEHFSNAGTKKPNPGQNLLELRLSASF